MAKQHIIVKTVHSSFCSKSKITLSVFNTFSLLMNLIKVINNFKKIITILNKKKSSDSRDNTQSLFYLIVVITVNDILMPYIII